MTGCGGGGGGGVPEPPPLLELGTFSATLPTRVSRTFLNPLNVSAAVSAPTADGPFQIDPEAPAMPISTPDDFAAELANTPPLPDGCAF